MTPQLLSTFSLAPSIRLPPHVHFLYLLLPGSSYLPQLIYMTPPTCNFSLAPPTTLFQPLPIPLALPTHLLLTEAYLIALK